jgi:hypothetical protein
MTLTLVSNVSAIGPGLTTYFLASGGTAPYIYSVLPMGAGGSINASTGQYFSPINVPSSVNNAYDTIQVIDATSTLLTLKILVGTALTLFCDILQNQLGLANDHIYVWNQKLMEPTDYNLYIAVSVFNSKPFGNTNYFNGATQQSIQSINMLDTLQIDAISRGPSARDNRANILMALNSNYSEQQQECNSFKIGTLPANSSFINLSHTDGAAIPYRFQIQVNMQYFVQLIQSVNYYDTFNQSTVLVNP